MRNKVHLSLLILCVIFTQGIGTPAKWNFIESSDLHVRQKRLIDRTPYGNNPRQLSHAPYIVNIRKNGYPNCAGSILEPSIILTAAHCFRNEDATYDVLTGTHYSHNGTRHTIVSRLIYPDYVPNVDKNDLALLTIFPPTSEPNQIISINTKYIPPNTRGIFSGWGCTHFEGGRWIYPDELRSMSIRIISLYRCRTEYHNIFPITRSEICVLDARQLKCGCNGDSGGPLVVNNKIIGVYSWSKGFRGNRLTPDVFMSLSYPPYKEWIDSHI